jgi:hypothetical protein
MSGRVAAAKGSSQSDTAKTMRKAAPLSRSEYSVRHQQSESAHPETFNPPKFSWSIGNVALNAPNERNQPSWDSGARLGAAQHTGPLPWPMQAKLEIGAVGDPLEHEADRAAEQVTRMPDPVAGTNREASHASSKSPVRYPTAWGQRAQVQRDCACGGSCDQCKAKESDDAHGKLHRKPDGPQLSRAPSSPATTGIEAPSVVEEALRSPGQPLDAATRAFFEPRFGHDFSDVRVRTGALAENSARGVNAHAYTVGHDIVFGAGRFAPQTREGQRLIAHELSHVIQQETGQNVGKVRRAPGDGHKDPSVAGVPDDAAEMWKDVVAQRHFQQSEGNVTFARMKIADGEGRTVVNILVESDKTAHAEEKAIQIARAQLGATKKLPGGKITFVTDQTVCSLAGRCRQQISKFAEELEVQEATATVFSRAALPAEPGDVATPKATAKKVTKQVVEGIELNSETETIYSRGGTGGPSGGTGSPPGKTPSPSDVQAGSPGAKPKSPADVHEDSPGSKPAAPTDTHEGSPGGKPAETHTDPQVGTAATPQMGRSSQVAIQIGTGIASLGLGWLAAYLKARVDKKIAQRQIDAFMDIAKRKINANPDEALKKMMFAPEVTVYAWVYLDSAVITTFGVDNASPEPVTSDSSPMIDFSRIDYAFAPVDQSLIESFPRISGGGRHVTMVRTIVIDIPLQTPSVEDMFAYAKTRNLPLDGLLDYALYRSNRSIAEYEIAMQDKRDLQKPGKEMNYWQNLVKRILQAMPHP